MTSPDTLNVGGPANPASAQVDTLDDLRSEARAMADVHSPADQAGSQPGANVPAVAVQTNAQIIGGVLTFARETFCAITDYQSPRVHLGGKEVDMLAQMWGGVCDTRGINLAAVQGQHWDLIMAGMATVPIALAIRTGLQGEMAARLKAGQVDQVQGGSAPPPPPPPPAAAAAAPGAAAPEWDGNMGGSLQLESSREEGGPR